MSYDPEANWLSVLCAVPCLGGSQIEVKMDKSAEKETTSFMNSSNFSTAWINSAFSQMHTPTYSYSK